MPAQRQMGGAKGTGGMSGGGGRGAMGRPAATGRTPAGRAKKPTALQKSKEVYWDSKRFSKNQQRKGWQQINASFLSAENPKISASNFKTPKKARATLKTDLLERKQSYKKFKKETLRNNFGKKTTKGTKPLRRRGPR